MRGRLHHVVIDCPDPEAIARFYSVLLDRPITYVSEDFVVVAADKQSSGSNLRSLIGWWSATRRWGPM